MTTTMLLLVSLSLLPFAGSQTFSIPLAWRKPTSTLIRSDRLALFDGLLTTISPTLNVSSALFVGLSIPQTANMLCGLAIGDAVNSSSTSKDLVLQSLNRMFTLFPTITESETPHVNSDPAIWGLAAIYAYRAYGDPTSLQHAQSMWGQLSMYLVTTEDATSGTHPFGGANISSICNGASTAGAVFFIPDDPNNLSANGETTAAFMALSAHLYEQTSMDQYLSAAILSADFLANQLYNNVIILDTINLGTCATSNILESYNSGFTIEGLSILAKLALTNSSDSYASFLSKLISTSVVFPQWTNSSDGVNIEGPTNGNAANTNGFGVALKAIFIRGLYQAYIRNSNDADQASFIRSYITVQFNALLDLASVPGHNVYSPRWEGPPPPTILPWGQLAAIDVLVSAIGLTDNQTMSMSPSSNSPSSIESSDLPSTSTLYPTTVSTSQPSVSHNTSHSLSPGVIGGIVAGVLSVLLVVTVALAWFMRRKHKKHHQYTSQRTVQQYPPLNVQGRTHARELATRVRSSVVRYGKRRAPTAVPNVDITIPRPSSVHSDHNATTPTTNSEPQQYDSETVNGREVGYIINGRQLVVDLSSFPVILDRHGLRVTTVGGNMTEIPSDHGGQDSEAPPQYEE